MTGTFSNGVIRLDTNPVGVYYSGQVISGSVLFDLDQPITFSVLYMQFLGEAKVLWTAKETEIVNGLEENWWIKYLGREEYFNFTQQLAGGTGTSRLPAGAQAFPFKFQIPFTAPSSFKGEQGEVSYSMTVNLVYTEKGTPNEDLKKKIQVVAPFDLNLGSPRIRQPVDLEFEEIYGCGYFCIPDPVTIRVRLPISGYCPGQTIPMSLEVQNESSVEITKMVFQLLSRELYRSQQPASQYISPEKVLVTMKKVPVMAHSKRKFTWDLVVPDMIPPYLENCGIIDVGYFFRITIKLSGCNDELQDEAELCLGLVPVRDFIEGEYVHPMAHSLPTGPIPVPDRPTELIVPPSTSLNGSTTSLQRDHHNSVQIASYPNNPLPYSSLNLPTLTENRFQAPVSVEQKPKPYFDYEIGFKAPERLSAVDMPYPSNVPSAVNPLPYPTNNLMPGYPSNVPSAVNPPPYPTNNLMPGYPSVVNPPPYPTSNLMPSAAKPYPTGHIMPQLNSDLPPYAPSAPPLN